MADIDTSGSAPTDEVSDKSDPTDSVDQSDKTGKTVSWDNHQRAINDMHRFKKEKRDLETKLGDLESERLKEKEDYKTLSERHEASSKEWQGKYEGLNSSLQNDRKYSAVRESAIKAGIRSEALDDLGRLELDGVELELTTNGRMLVHGADEYVEGLKKPKAHWFKDKKMPTVNTGGAGVEPTSTEKLTASKLVELERKLRGNPVELKKLYARYEQERLKA